jgi:hypothetical protein
MSTAYSQGDPVMSWICTIQARGGGKETRTCAEAIYGGGRAEERFCDLLLLLDEDRVALGELSEALDGRDAGTCHADQGDIRLRIRLKSTRTDIGEEDQERQQDDEEVAVPNDEASVKLNAAVSTNPR